jgi:hypothetical protein
VTENEIYPAMQCVTPVGTRVLGDRLSKIRVEETRVIDGVTAGEVALPSRLEKWM